MSIVERISSEIRTAMKNRDTSRLECLRLLKGALLLKEKESGAALTDDAAVAVLRSEVRKRKSSIDVFREHGKEEEAVAAEREIEIIGEFLPRQLSEAELEAKVRAYLDDHPEIRHAGKLTGALKKELGDAADGRMLNAICRKALEGGAS